MIDNNIVVVSYARYDQLERENPMIRKAVVEVRESTILLNKDKIRTSAQEQCKKRCGNTTNFNEKCNRCKLAKQTRKLLS
jgi:hypothetical protein